MRIWHYPKRRFEDYPKRWKDDDKKDSEQGIQQAGETMYSRGQATPEELAQYKSSFDIGNLLNQIYKYKMGLGTAPTGYQTPEQQYQMGGDLARTYYGQTLKGALDPYAAYESQLQPALQSAQDYINRGAQQRGLLRSGIPIEQMGRAGVDLAIKEAQDRMNFRSQELARAGELSSYMTGQEANTLTGMANLYGQQQQAGQGAMGRQAGQAVQAAQYQAYPYQAQLGQSYGQQGNMGALAGAGLGVLGASLIPVTGGLSANLALMGLAGAGGAQLGRSL